MKSKVCCKPDDKPVVNPKIDPELLSILDKLLTRLVRIESRLVNLIEYHGMTLKDGHVKND